MWHLARRAIVICLVQSAAAGYHKELYLPATSRLALYMMLDKVILLWGSVKKTVNMLTLSQW